MIDPRQGPPETTLQVRRAVQGDPAGLGWTVTHFTPFLLAQARYRIGRRLQAHLDPEDLVQRTWAIAIPRLRDVAPRNGRFTPVLLRFLSSILLRDYWNLMSKHGNKPMTVQPELAGASETDSAMADPVARIPAPHLGVAQELIRTERVAALYAAIANLSEDSREVIILHAIEQVPFKDISAKLGTNESTLRSRYHRALHELKARFPLDMIEEMDDSGE